MTTNSSDPPSTTPESAVKAWWASVQAGDLSALEQLVVADFVSVGAPGGRTSSREQFLAQARAVIGLGMQIHDWNVVDMEIRRRGDVAVCAYRWREQGDHQGRRFEMSGEATDVLVRDGEGWRYQAHHVGPVNDAPSAE